MVNQTFAQMSNLLVYSAMTVYALAMVAFAVDLAGRGRAGVAAAAARAVREVVPAGGPPTHQPPTEDGSDPAVGAPGGTHRALGIAVALTWLGVLLHAGAVLTRGLSVARVPWANMYEFSMTGALVVVAVYLGLIRWRPGLRTVGIFAVGPVLLTLGLGMTVLYTQAAQLVPALQSPFLVIHVSIAFISAALFTVAFSVQILQLVQDRRQVAQAAGRQTSGATVMGLFPSAADLERLGYRLIAASFPLWTFTLVAGAIWAEKAWGRYWGWDPKEVWTFVVWAVYAAYLHARVTRGWDGRRATYLALAGFAGVIINFTVVNILFTGQHSYAGIG